jgi:hypothetical protein
MRTFLSRAAAAAFTLLVVATGASAAEGPNSMDAATETKLKSLLAGPKRADANKLYAGRWRR